MGSDPISTFTSDLRGGDLDLAAGDDKFSRVARGIWFLTSMYHDTSRVRAFAGHLRMLERPPDVDVQLLVTDNGRERRMPRLRGVELFRPSRNLGYLGGCVFALESRLARGHVLPEFVCVSNTDLALDDDFLTRLANAEVADDVGILAPDVRLPNAAPQNPLLWRRPARAMMLAYAVLARSRLFAHAFEAGVRIRHALRAAKSDSGQETIYAPHGSIVVLHRRFFERGGKLQYGAMMFGEEIHIAEQARRVGLRVVWRRDLRVLHDQHATMRHVHMDQRHRWLAESAGVLWREYFDAPAGDL